MTQKNECCGKCKPTTMEDINYPGMEIPISKPICVDDGCPCHTTTESNVVNSMTPEEQKKQDELQASAVLTTTEKKCKGCEIEKENPGVEQSVFHNKDCPHKGQNNYDLQGLPTPEKKTCRFHPNGCINDGVHSTTDTSDWRKAIELGGDIFDYEGDPRPNAKATLTTLIEKELERARANGYADGCSNPNYNDGFEAGQQAEQSRIIKLAEESFVESVGEHQTWEDSDYDSNTVRFGFNAALDTLISKIKNDK